MLRAPNAAPGIELRKLYPQKYSWVLASAMGWMLGGAMVYPIPFGIVSGIITGIAFCQIIEASML